MNADTAIPFISTQRRFDYSGLHPRVRETLNTHPTGQSKLLNAYNPNDNLSCSKYEQLSLYDRQLNTALFKRLHATNFTLIPKTLVKQLGPGSYNPLTIDEIYQKKTCRKFGPYYQRSNRFPSTYKNTISPSCIRQALFYNINNRGRSNMEQLERKKRLKQAGEKKLFERRFNSVRLDLQNKNGCYERQALMIRAPPVTLYEKSSFIDEVCKQTGIYGPFVQFANERDKPIPTGRFASKRDFRGPGKQSLSLNILDDLFSKHNKHKGAFLPKRQNESNIIPGFLSPQAQLICRGPTVYHNDGLSDQRICCSRLRTLNSQKQAQTPGVESQDGGDRKASRLKNAVNIDNESKQIGFLSSTERFRKAKNLLKPGPSTYSPERCIRPCSNKKFVRDEFLNQQKPLTIAV
ncbi:unnamed protein product [Didymodactylos carnosus]|uniref:Uncharacterized protein n=1 Tax=Didymodactylos carnosus TaxID=1234261 RepID=A0A814GQJ3_9BILA|nr:unnamed protein product [Didymodactylos carnosus]CAF1189566.1 unnamed protein product [Didymodactylos carnosus]CAF3771114.1 unnamed protein product [Didymodactylos carnosus]CAF4000605.1 unnamed protein product [Didymodactylos carnosus]